MQQRRQLQRVQRGQLGGFQHYRISSHECGQRFRCWDREGIIPWRYDSDDPMRLTQDAPRLGFHRQIAVWNRLFAQKVEGILNAEARSVEHHHNFGKESFDHRLTGFASNQRGNFRLFFVKQALKFAQHRNSPMHAEYVPGGLRRASASDSRMNMGAGRRIEFTQDFAGRGVHRENLSCYLDVSRHAW